MEDNLKPGDWLIIVGIVSDVRQSLTDKPGAAIYEPYQQVSQPGFLDHMSFVVQTSGNPMAMSSAIRSVIHKVDRDLPTQSVATMEAIVADSMSEARSQTRLLGIFSMIALALAAIGIYGVLTSSVAERTREIGIRMAVGAEPHHILTQFLIEALSLSIAGGLIGVAFGVGTATWLAHRFHWPVLIQPDVIAVSVGFSALVGIVFGIYPAWKASQLDPIDALRFE